MEINSINNTVPQSGHKPATDSIPVLTAPSSGTQPLTANAVKTITPTEKTTTGKQADNQPTTDITQIKKNLQTLTRASGLEFAVDDQLGQIIIKILDPETRETLKQIPTEEALHLAHTLHSGNGSLHRAEA